MRQLASRELVKEQRLSLVQVVEQQRMRLVESLPRRSA
jgi:hypothetical protein